MDMDDILKPKGNFVFRDIADESILVPIVGGVGEMDSIFTLNETGAVIWRALNDGASVGDMVGAIEAEFDVDTSTAEHQVTEFLHLLMDRELIQTAED